MGNAVGKGCLCRVSVTIDIVIGGADADVLAPVGGFSVLLVRLHIAQ